MIRGAAEGNPSDRAQFVRVYEPVVRAYLVARWRTVGANLDDAIQEVFLACFQPEGVLERADPERPGGFRAFLYGVARNVARQVETRQARRREQPLEGEGSGEPAAEDESLAQAFDRAWAKALMREAGRLQEEQAATRGPAALQRVELLRLRFHEGLPIRDIARQWGVEASVLHHEYARAREEFRSALHEVVAFHHPGSPEQVERVCGELAALLG